MPERLTSWPQLHSLSVKEPVYVVGGGNSAGQAVMHLAKHARSVTMLVRDKTLAASMSQYLSERILGAANVQAQYDVEITGLEGEKALERIRIGSRTTKEASWATTPRLFVAIGGVPLGDRRPGFLRGRGCAPPLDQARCHRSRRRRDGHRLRSQIPGRNGMIAARTNDLLLFTGTS